MCVYVFMCSAYDMGLSDPAARVHACKVRTLRAIWQAHVTCVSHQ